MIEQEDEVDIIFDRDVRLRLIKRNELWFAYGSDESKNDKEVVLAVKSIGLLIIEASSNLKQDKEVVLEAVKSSPRIVVDLYCEILVDNLVFETACYYNSIQFRDAFILKHIY